MVELLDYLGLPVQVEEVISAVVLLVSVAVSFFRRGKKVRDRVGSDSQ